MSAPLRVSRVQRKGQVTIPQEFRERLGIQEGDFVAFTETANGLLLTRQQIVPAATVDTMERAATVFRQSHDKSESKSERKPDGK